MAFYDTGAHYDSRLSMRRRHLAIMGCLVIALLAAVGWDSNRNHTWLAYHWGIPPGGRGVEVFSGNGMVGFSAGRADPDLFGNWQTGLDYGRKDVGLPPDVWPAHPLLVDWNAGTLALGFGYWYIGLLGILLWSHLHQKISKRLRVAAETPR
jgi:hypothetical protein